ncbi:MAG: hypothetical protein ACREUU_07735 [Gammaproteobacteria bacterium]
MRFSQAVTTAALVVAAETPAIRQAVGLEGGQDHLDIGERVRRHVVEARVVNPAGGIFDVVRVVAQPAQPDQIMQELISHPGLLPQGGGAKRLRYPKT